MTLSLNVIILVIMIKLQTDFHLSTIIEKRDRCPGGADILGGRCPGGKCPRGKCPGGGQVTTTHLKQLWYH